MIENKTEQPNESMNPLLLGDCFQPNYIAPSLLDPESYMGHLNMVK